MRQSALLAVVAAAVLGCSSQNSAGAPAPGGAGGSGGSGDLGGSGDPAGSGASGGSGGPAGGGSVDGQNADGGPAPDGIIYAHSATELYRLDPNSKVVTLVGAFQGCTKVADLALDSNSNAFV